jgi:hypothetical protein
VIIQRVLPQRIINILQRMSFDRYDWPAVATASGDDSCYSKRSNAMAINCSLCVDDSITGDVNIPSGVIPHNEL